MGAHHPRGRQGSGMWPQRPAPLVLLDWVPSVWEGWGLFPKCAPHPAGETRRSSAWNARRQAQRRPATGAGRPAPGRSGSGRRTKRVWGRPGPAWGAGAPGQLGSGRAPPAGICMTKRGAGGSGRAEPARGRSCPAKPPPRARRPPGAGGPPGSWGRGRHASPALSCVCSGGAARGGGAAARDKGRV